MSEEISSNVERVENEGRKDIITYFNLIHNKLFSLNSLIIAGGLAMSAWKPNVIIIICVLVSFFILVSLIYIDYRMMESSRNQANIKNRFTEELINKDGSYLSNTNLISLSTIILSVIILTVFIFVLI